MNEQVILQSKIYHWVLISLFVIFPVFYLSVLFFPTLFQILAASFILLFLFELAAKRSQKNWFSLLVVAYTGRSDIRDNAPADRLAFGLFSSDGKAVGHFHWFYAHSGLQRFCSKPRVVSMGSSVSAVDGIAA